MSGIGGVLARPGGPRPSPTAAESMGRRLPLGGTTGDRGAMSTLTRDPIALAASVFGRHRGGIASTERDGRLVALAVMGSFFDPALAPEAVPEQCLQRYLDAGISFVQGLRGEAAVAVWDGRTDTLFLVTDRFRVHALYYADRPEQFVFGSRIGALFASSIGLPAVLRPAAIADAVGTSIIPTPMTAFRDVDKMPPGTVLTHHGGRTTLAPYWNVDFRNPSRESQSALTRELRAHFTEAIARRFREDGDPERLGAFLSGGVDSSTVTGVLQQVAGRPMKSFSIGFGEARYNEISYARIAAESMHAEHFEYFVVPKDVFEALPELLAAYDEPYANASSIPTYFCARLARNHGVDVLYGGDGGDELFGGNERYATAKLFEPYTRLPRWFGRGVVSPLVRGMAGATKMGLFVKGAKYIRRAELPAAKRLTSYDFFNVIPLADFLTPEFLEEVGRDYNPSHALEELYDRAPGPTELDRQLYLDLHLTISDNDVVKVTRATEAAGVTVRFPFLDQDLAAFAMTVPAGMKMRGRHLRTFFKKAYADLLPPEVRSKSKHGFGLPIAEWLRTDPALAEMMNDAILSPRSLARGYFRKEALVDLLDRHRADMTSFFGTTLWNLVILELWLRRQEEEARSRD